jgi:hypothetical protein
MGKGKHIRALEVVLTRGCLLEPKRDLKLHIQTTRQDYEHAGGIRMHRKSAFELLFGASSSDPFVIGTVFKY